VGMHRSAKPVRKCHGCGLNLGDHCGVFENPHEMWAKHAVCPGYKNEKLLAQYQASQARKQVDVKKEKRRQVAKLRRTVTRIEGDRHVIMAVLR
jgi:hypothetical protein